MILSKQGDAIGMKLSQKPRINVSPDGNAEHKTSYEVPSSWKVATYYIKVENIYFHRRSERGQSVD